MKKKRAQENGKNGIKVGKLQKSRKGATAITNTRERGNGSEIET